MSFALDRVFVTKIAIGNFRDNHALRSGTSRQVKRTLCRSKSTELALRLFACFRRKDWLALLFSVAVSRVQWGLQR